MFEEHSQASQRVLVCIVTQPSEMQRIRTESWYRIPLLHAPQGLSVGYLAFYLTAAFACQRYCILEYAQVVSISIARRCELLPEQAQHPRAQQRYLRYNLGVLQSLAQPIPSRKWRRISFIPTTLTQLLHAGDVSELWDSNTPGDYTALWGAGIGRRSLH